MKVFIKNLNNLADFGGNQRWDTDGMVIYVGEGGGGMFNTPYFDQEMVTNYTVQVKMNVNAHFKRNQMYSLY